MSEYQSYAFQAIDRRLTDKEMAELRSVSASSLAFPGEALAHDTAQIDDISDATVLNDYRPATGAGGRASNAARKLLDAGHLEHIETNKETDPAYKKGSRPKTYITTS